MTPEISRRCQSCGAAIRAAAMFCPECGKALEPAAEKSSRPTVGESAPNSPPAADPKASTMKSEPPATTSTKHGPIEKAREGLHKASSVTREAFADNVKRVEKIRQVSSTMIEEAAYDPSLRFVLVALAIFVVFIILLVLSKVMG